MRGKHGSFNLRTREVVVKTTAVRLASGIVCIPPGCFGPFSSEAVRGCSIQLEGVHLGEALGVDPEGKRDHEVAAVEGRRQAAVDILRRV
jgi:hypothetical protein